MPPTLDIVIVNWNTRETLADCLRSIEAIHLATVELQRVVVVDNASSDDSLSGLNGLALPLCIERNATNRGFAAACNQGARESRADYLLFLNPDTRLTCEALEQPVAFMDEPANGRVGICGIRLLDDRGLAGTCSARFPTPQSMWLEGTGLHRLAPSQFAVRCQSGFESAIENVDQVIGAYLLMRHSLFDQLNGFDERFFVYFEEVDLSLRAREAGYKSCILGNITAYHKGCASSDQVKDKRLFYFWRSRLLYARKHYSVPQYGGLLVLTLATEPLIRLLQALLSVSAESVRVTARAYFYLVRYWIGARQYGHTG